MSIQWNDAKERTDSIICACLSLLAIVGMYFLMQ